ncbi:kinase-like protein, partial [Paxillus ammoniavirescens]
PIYPRDLTGHVVREGGEPFTSGGFGDVYRGKLCLSERSIDVAVKVMKTYLIDDGNDRDKKNMKLCREFQTWADLKHFNILPLFGLTTDFKQFPAMVCPWLENGSLTSYLERRNDTLTIMERLALVRILHSQCVVHGDLSGSNVLIDGNGKACISDFGLSVLLAELGGSTYTNSCHVGGAVRWIAPELLDHEVPGDENKPLHLFPTLQSDVYSFGMVILQVLTGKVPYHYIVPVARVQSAILHRKIPLRPQQQLVTDSQWKFMQRCWMPVGVPEPRPRSDEIVEFVRQELDACRESLMELT